MAKSVLTGEVLILTFTNQLPKEMTRRLCLTCIGIIGTLTLAAQKNFPLLKVIEISKNSPDTFCIKGIVKEVYTCPPCPPGAQCKPCIGDHIQVTDAADQKNYLRLFTDDPTKLVVNQKYLYTVWLRNRSHPTDFLHLISFEKLDRKK